MIGQEIVMELHVFEGKDTFVKLKFSQVSNLLQTSLTLKKENQLWKKSARGQLK